MPDRLCCPVDAYMFLARDGKLLMLKRAADAACAEAFRDLPQLVGLENTIVEVTCSLLVAA
jgi:hypothetical protein